MSKKERELLTQFMNAVMYKLCPDINSMPMREMRAVEWSKGAGFDNTEFEDNEPCLTAYWMWDAIEKLEKLSTT